MDASRPAKIGWPSSVIASSGAVAEGSRPSSGLVCASRSRWRAKRSQGMPSIVRVTLTFGMRWLMG